MDVKRNIHGLEGLVWFSLYTQVLSLYKIIYRAGVRNHWCMVAIFFSFGDALPLNLSSVKLCVQFFLVCEYTVDRGVEDGLKGKRARGFLFFFFLQKIDL